MLKCSLCKRQTERGESTGRFITYRNKKYENGSIGREAESEVKTCINCSGGYLKKNG